MAINQPPRIAFCGRPNVGKSSLFNRLLGKKKAIVLDEPGVTRDVYRTTALIEGCTVELADLAGLEFIGDKDPDQDSKSRDLRTLKRLATQAALEYLKDADLVLFVVDAREPSNPVDQELARTVRRTTKGKILVVLAKAEGNVGEAAQEDAIKLGWGEGVPTSAEHNLGIQTLKEQILETLELEAKPEIDAETDLDFDADFDSDADSETSESSDASDVDADTDAVIDLEDEIDSGLSKFTADRPMRLGVYGRPNVGKSTLVNRLLGTNRMITSPIAGTTVDTIDSFFERDGKHYQILDTAGIRRKSKTEQGVEVLSVVQALKSLSLVDIALFLIDGYEGVTDQDEKIAGELVRAGKPVVIVVNKWDLCRLPKKEDYAGKIREAMGFLEFAPVVFISAERGEGTADLFDLLNEVLKQRMTVAPTGELNRFFEQVEGTNNPTGVRLFYATQTSKNPPTITCLVSDPKKVHFAYERFLINELRQRYGWMGSPLKLVFKARKRSESKKSRRGDHDSSGKYFK